MVLVFLPSAVTVLIVCVCISPSVLMVRVWLLSGGPGSNFDLATLSCQVPSHVPSAYASDPQASSINASTVRVANLLCRDSMIMLLVVWCALLIALAGVGGKLRRSTSDAILAALGARSASGRRRSSCGWE